MIPIVQPVLGQAEIDAVVEVLRSGHLVQGKVVAELERRFAAYIGVRHAVAVSSGTAALHLALLATGVGPGDEVITSPFTFIASANAVLYTGARPVFVDIREDTFNLDSDLVAAAITPRTKAILPVHLYGLPADMPALRRIADRYGLAIVEDAAQAHGAGIGPRKVGTFGVGCFSFYATKNMTTAEGGIITTDDDDTANELRMLRSHGQSERYHHDILGYNYRLTDVHAAIGLVQLDRLEANTRARIGHAAFLNAHLRQVTTPFVPDGYRHVYHQYTVRIPHGRDEVARQLTTAGVGTSIHYPVPVHRQKLYRDLGFDVSLPVAERVCREVLSLPVHPALSFPDIQEIARTVDEIVAASAFDRTERGTVIDYLVSLAPEASL
jgi:dTDP-4-amino-4,6-dideoxygalactose transaminase